MNEQLSDLQKQHQASQDKYNYFLLAAAGACIAFAMEKAQGVPLTSGLVMLGVSVASWSFSFFCGCKCVNTIQALLRANANLLSVHAGTHENQPQHPDLLAAAIRGIKTAIDINMKRANQYNEWQFRFFLSGGVSFVAWRIMEVIRLAPKP